MQIIKNRRVRTDNFQSGRMIIVACDVAGIDALVAEIRLSNNQVVMSHNVVLDHVRNGAGPINTRIRTINDLVSVCRNGLRFEEFPRFVGRGGVPPGNDVFLGEVHNGAVH